MTRVVAATITHGHRWQFLKQVLPKVMRDKHISRFVLVDNGSADREAIREGVAEYGDKVRIVTHEKNQGSAGGFAAALEAAREEDADFVLVLDDDSVPDDDFITKYLEAYHAAGGGKVGIAGARANIGDDPLGLFYPKRLYPLSWYKHTFFEVFSLRKFIRRVRERLFGKRGDTFVPLVPIPALVYGGAFLPMEAVREAPLPDKELFLYGDDIDYSWCLAERGYTFFYTMRPSFNDVDVTFAGSHITGLFEEKVPEWKVYYRLRNMVRLSRKHRAQPPLVLLVNVIAWFAALVVVGFVYTRGGPIFWKRARIAYEAARAGYDEKRPLPPEAKF